MTAHAEPISRLETDLLKSYILEFYESISEDMTPSGMEQNVNNDAADLIVETEPEEVADLEPEVQPVKLEPDADSFVDSEPVAEPSETTDVDAQPDLLADLIEEMNRNQSSSHIGESFQKDIRKSLGLNDKLLFANSLFEGNQSKLIEVLDHIDELDSFEEAQVYLSDLANDYKWSDAARRQSAVKLLHLINLKFKSA